MLPINNEFIRIPNIIADDTKIPPTAKYLYGIIDMLSYVTPTTTKEELCKYSQITHNTLIKHLQLLEEYGYIENKRTKYGIKVTPLINKDIEILHRDHKRDEFKINNEIDRKIALQKLAKQVEQLEKDHQFTDENGTPIYVKKLILALK